MAELLRLDNVTAGYGDSVVLEQVSVSMQEADSLALLGRNGVGKTTLLITLMGLTRVRSGQLHWRGTDIARLPPYKRAHAGLGWVPQERYLFPSLTVEEHLTAVARQGVWDLNRVYGVFLALRSAGAILAISSPAESSRCLHSVVRRWSIQVSCCWMSRWRAWRRLSFRSL